MPGFALRLLLARHVVDEAVTDVLSFLQSHRPSSSARFGWFPMPEFTCDVWITELCTLVILLLVLSQFAYIAACGCCASRRIPTRRSCC